MTGEGEPERRRIVGAVRRLLSKADSDGWQRDLARDLFARADIDDLAAAGPQRLAAFVEAAATLLAERMSGEAIIRVTDLAAGKDEATLVEVLNDNMPFLVDSIIGEVQAARGAIRLVAHPVVSVERDREGRLTAYHGGAPVPPPAIRESLIQIEIDRIGEGEQAALAGRLDSLLVEVRNAVADWRAMLDRLAAEIAAWKAAPPPIPAAETAEAIAFLEWLAEGNFTFLGAREYVFAGDPETAELRRAGTRGLGILADPDMRVLRRGGEGASITPAIRALLLGPEPLIITKSDLRSRVHRRAYADYIGIKRYAADGTLAGELRFVGLFTSTAYTRSARTIPLLRQKVAHVIAEAGFDPDSHSGKGLLNVLEVYPRDELFQIDEQTLFGFALLILALEEHPRVRVLARRDKFDRFVSVLAYVPRDRYDSDVRTRIGDYLATAFDGHVSAFHPGFPEGTLARVHFIIGRSGTTPTPDPLRRDLEAAVEEIIRLWEDELAEAIAARFPADELEALAGRYMEAFPAAYREAYAPDEAAADIATFEGLSAERSTAVAFSPADDGDPAGVTLKIIHRGAPISLSTRVPVLENMGFTVIDEQTYAIHPADEAGLHIHDMVLREASGRPVNDAALARLDDCFMAVRDGLAEDDGYNGLVVAAGLAWRDIAVLRTASRYLHQAGVPWSQRYMAATLNRHAGIARTIAALFHARLAPDGAGEAAAKEIQAGIETALEAVASLDEDRIVRRFANLINATVRTNFFQPAPDGGRHTEIALKFDPALIEELPAPKPFREIFVHSPRVDGLHLRFGPVARGGIRWSDRPLDFRTEVLGLAKAQQVKNAVIIPVGAKGGFVPKRLPAGDRAGILAEGTAAYRIFIGSLLDVTDNLDGDAVIPPADVVRRDGNDPYLVVAADKGTATFSDTANAIAEEHGFWLGDAFASGGSAGYDHKKMGITARGAWEAVKRHFREMDIDIQTTPFTAVGVGDMSGDVFGNGMLLSPAMKLVAAFDHRDIFVDPDPDTAVSFAERQRLFDLPRSSWQDYDRAALSAGGAVFSRAEKTIRPSREVRALLDLPGERVAPNELIRAILKARADLLYFGGIGTFVRAAAESDDRVGDRANDAVRVTAEELRVKVVGEGGNLGMTQRARIAYGLAGGRCNSDAIDNSAGVNASDLEVNIKIAVGRSLRDGRLDLKRRNRLLASMTGEVAALVLRNNYLQPLAISLARSRGFEDFGFQLRLMQSLESAGRLDRALEVLPDDVAMAERQSKGQPLTRAEIGVLLAYAKTTLVADLVAGRVADDPTLDDALTGYFPAKMRKAYAADIEGHRLRAEIIATVIGNAMINRGGPTYLVRVGDRTGAAPVDVARAYVVVRDSFALEDLNDAIDALDGRISGTVQLDLYRAVQDLLIDRTIWFLRYADLAGDVGPVAASFGRTIAKLADSLDNILPELLAAGVAARNAALAGGGVPEPLAERMAALSVLAAATDIHLVAEELGAGLDRTAATFFAAGDALRISRIGALAANLPLADYYDALARDRALESLAITHRQVAASILAAGGAEPWRAARSNTLVRAMATIVPIADSDELTLSRLTVAANVLADLARS